MAYIVQSRVGQPWEDWEDARMLGELKAGRDPWLVAKRINREEHEVRARMAELAKPKAPARKATRRRQGLP